MRSTISKDMKTYAEYDATIPEVKEFAKIWIKSKKQGGGGLPLEVKKITAKCGFVGSGEWTYEYNGNTFEVYGSANGEGFWGTDYSISLI